MLLVVGFLAVAILIYVNFESTMKAKTEEKKTEMAATSKITKAISPEAPNPTEEPGWQRYEKNDPAGIFIDEDKKLELRYKFGTSEENEAERPFLDDVGASMQGDHPAVSSLVPNVYLHDYSTYLDNSGIGNVEPEVKEVGDVNALENGDQYFGPNSSAPILLSWITDTGEHKTIYKNDPNLTLGNFKLYRKIEDDQTITTMLKYNWEMKTGFFKGYRFEATNVLKPYKGTIRVETYMKNVTPVSANKPALKNITLDSHYPIGLGYTQNAGIENPIFYIGSNRGLYMQYENHLRTVYRLNYFFNVSNSVTNWIGASNLASTWNSSSSSKEQRAEAERNGFLNKDYIFNGITGAGNEKDNGKAGTNVPEPPVWAQLPSKDPAFSMKSSVADSFEAGDTLSYAFNIGLQKIDATPSIVLDETEGFRLKGQNTYSLKGQWFDSDSLELDLFYSVDGGAVKGPYRQRTTEDMLGEGIEFSIDLTEPGDLKPQDHEIEVFAKDVPQDDGSGLEPVESNHENFKLIYVDDDPKIELEETIGNVLPGGYKVKGRYIGKDEKYKPATISYKKATDPDSEYKEMTLVNSPDQTFEFTIPERDMPDLNGTYVFSIRAENKYGVLSNIEDVLLSNEQTKPKFTLSEKSKENLLNKTAENYPIDFASFTHTGLFYPLTIQYKVDGEKEWQQITDQPVGAMTSVLTEVTEGSKTINLPASRLPFGENHVVHFIVSDRFGIMSDEQSVTFKMPGKPVIESLDKETDFSMGVDYTVSGTVSLTDAYFPFTFHYKIGRDGYSKEALLTREPNLTDNKFSFVIPKEELPKGEKHVIYITAMDKFGQLSNVSRLTLEGIKTSNVKVKFIDDSVPAKPIGKELTFTQEIETTIELGEQKSVQDTLKELEERYTLKIAPPSKLIEFKEEETIVEYVFTGKLFVASFP